MDSSEQQAKTKRAELILLGIVFIWGLNTPVMKMGILAMEPMVYNTSRLLVAALLSLAALGYTRAYRPMPAGDIRQLLQISILGFFLNQVLIIIGMSLTTAGNASLVFATLPVEVALINFLLKIEFVSCRMAVGIFLGFFGVFLVLVGSGNELSLFGPHMTGAALLLTGQSCYAYYTVFSKRLVQNYSMFQIIACVLSVNAILFVLISLPELRQADWAAIPPTAWYSIAFSAALGLFFSNAVWVWVVGELGSTKAALSQYLCPVLSIAFAWAFLQESFGLLQFLGAVVTFWGLSLTRK